MFEDSASTTDYETFEGDTTTEEPVGLTDSQSVRLQEEVKAEVPGLGNDPGLGLMLELAKQGEFDPWDVDIVALTDSYLEALDEQLDAQELGAVARLIFYAAALIHLKARALAEREAQIKAQEEAALLDEVFDELTGDLLGHGSRLYPGDEPLIYPDFMTGDGPRGGIQLAPRERTPRNRGVTLVDLIAALRTYDERLAQREAELEEEPLFDGEIAYQECVEGSHQDDLDGDLITVRQDLWDRMLQTERPCVQLSELVTCARNKEATYLALLFLAQDGEIYLEQDDFYGEVRVKRGEFFGEIRAGVREAEELERERGEFDEDEAAQEDLAEDETDAEEASEADDQENDATEQPLPDEEEEGQQSPTASSAIEQEEQQ